MSGEQQSTDGGVDEAVAVVGLAGRFPGARTVEEFWENLRAGREAVADLAKEELLAAGVPRSLLDRPGYVRRAAVIEGYQEFDAEFFGIPPGTAAQMDPQQRLFLQACWHALEDAGHDPARREGTVGVFAAPSFNGYFGYNLLSHHDPREFFGGGTTTAQIHSLTLCDPNFFATRVAHALDLHGPALTVQTACSGSLVAVHLACQSLLSGESDLALAGGMTVKVPHPVGYLYEPGSMMSADGRCRPFDAAAGGTVFGSGGGVVALKRLSDALEDGDRVRAVIRGTAVNNDGALKMGFTAPSVEMQAAVVAEALAVAGTDPDEVGYVEAHGTGTPLGDPVELAALRQALDPEGDRTVPCLIGSAKGNIGHLEAASGVAGLIKTVLALEHGVLPGTVHFTEPNPELGLKETPFEVVAQTRAWPGAGPRVAGVSSLGVGGTNAHVVVAQAPAPLAFAPGATGTGTEAGTGTGAGAVPQDAAPVLLVSARTPEALREARHRLAGALGPRSALADVARTLAARRAFAFRSAVAAEDPQRAAELLREERTPAGLPAVPPSPVLLLPGQGAQYPGMGAGLYRRGGRFRRELDHCAELFAAALGGRDIRRELFGDSEQALQRTDVAQPALFAVGYALARTLEEYGVRPAALGGHSVGEFTAACLAGVFSLEDAVRLVAARGRLMHTAPAGTMLAVRLPEERLRELLDGTGLEIAAVNEPAACVVAGPAAEAEEFAARAVAAGTGVSVLRTAHAFHTAAMDGAAREFAAVVRTAALSAPAVPLVSNVTGGWMTGAEAADPERWAAQLRGTVRWAECASTLLDGAGRVLVEAGPGRTLVTAARRSTAWSDRHRAVNTLRHAQDAVTDAEVLGRALGVLWEAGVEVDRPEPAGAPGPAVPLPGYPFRRVRHWTDPAYGTAEAAPSKATRTAGTAGAAGAARPAVSAGNTGNAGHPADPGAGSAAAGVAAVLAGIWAEVLGVETVRPDDDFFDLGGDSMLASRVAAGALACGLEFHPKDVFENPTVSRLAARITRTGK
ncbi:type I polyketide synthase [Streptomyces sp. NPDC055607]